MPAIEILLEEMYEPKYLRGHSNGLLVHLISNGTFASLHCAVNLSLLMINCRRRLHVYVFHGLT